MLHVRTRLRIELHRPVKNDLLQSVAVRTERYALCVSFGQLVICYLTRSTGTLFCLTFLIALDSRRFA